MYTPEIVHTGGEFFILVGIHTYMGRQVILVARVSESPELLEILYK